MLTLPTFPLLPALPIISQSVPHEPVDWRGTFMFKGTFYLSCLPTLVRLRFIPFVS